MSIISGFSKFYKSFYKFCVDCSAASRYTELVSKFGCDLRRQPNKGSSLPVCSGVFLEEAIRNVET
jgi:hypothetical protein